MSDLKNQRRLAASIMKVGENRVWIDPETDEDVEAAITREDVRELIEIEVIQKRAIVGISRGRARAKAIKQKYGHRKGQGSRKGTKGARNPKKKQWMKKIRAQRRVLKELRAEETIDETTYRLFYRKSKGGEYRNVAHMMVQLQNYRSD